MSLFTKIKKFLRWLFPPVVPRKRRPFLSRKIRARAHINLNKRLRKFNLKYKREPTKKEFKWIVINTSHDTIKKRDKRGHWIRQKIRKVLCEEKGIPFTMRR
jgi:hypothetical protein